MNHANPPLRWGGLVLALLVMLPSCGKDEETFEYQTWTAEPMDLRITIRQKGEIEARDPVAVKNPIEGRPILLEVVPEGSHVKKGDFLFELDVSSQKDKLLQQKIQVNNAQQALFNAEKQLEIQKAQNESDTKKAELDILFAELDLEQYNKGDLPQQREEFSAAITLAFEELKRQQDVLKWSEVLAKKGFISNDKLESDRLAVKRREIDRDLNKKKLSVLEQFTARKRKRELVENLAEAKRELKRVSARAEAALAQKKSDLDNRKALFDLETKKLQKLQFMIEHNVVNAPREGIVIYGREGRGRESKPIEPGSTLREGQTIVFIPDMDKVLVDVDVHESSIHLVRLGMPVIVTTDTGETLRGVVEKVATVADSQSWYRNPDLKVYSTKVTVDNKDGSLKPGMNCYAEIIIDDLKDVVALPVQAVQDNGLNTYCWIKKDGEPVLTQVEVGLHNDEFIEIKSGVKAGDEVYLAKPKGAETPPTPNTKDLAAKRGRRRMNRQPSTKEAPGKMRPRKGGKRPGGRHSGTRPRGVGTGSPGSQ